MEINVDGLSALAQLADRLEEAGPNAPVGVARALNHTWAKAKTAAANEAKRIYTAKPRVISSAIRTHRATKSNLEARFGSHGRKISAHLFEHTPKSDTTGKKRKPVYLTVRRGEQSYVEKGFIWKGAIQQRIGGRRFVRVMGVSVPEMLSEEKIKTSVNEIAKNDLPPRIEHEISNLLERG